MKPERDILKEITTYLDSIKCISSWLVWFRMPTQGVMQNSGGRKFLAPNPNKGMADLLVIYSGKAIWVEVKTEIGKQSEYQEIFEHKVTEAECPYIVVHSIDEFVGKFLYFIRSQEFYQDCRIIPYLERFCKINDNPSFLDH